MSRRRQSTPTSSVTPKKIALVVALIAGLGVAIWTMPENEETGIVIDTTAAPSGVSNTASNRGGAARPTDRPQAANDPETERIANTLEKPDRGVDIGPDHWLARFDRFRSVHRPVPLENVPAETTEHSPAITPNSFPGDGVQRWAMVAKENQLFVRATPDAPMVAVSLEAKPEAVYGSRRRMAWMRNGTVIKQTVTSTPGR